MRRGGGITLPIFHVQRALLAVRGDLWRGGGPGQAFDDPSRTANSGYRLTDAPFRDGRGELRCPYHLYRASTDILPLHGSVLANLNTMPALADALLSAPGCWADPDSKHPLPLPTLATARACGHVKPSHRPTLRYAKPSHRPTLPLPCHWGTPGKPSECVFPVAPVRDGGPLSRLRRHEGAEAVRAGMAALVCGLGSFPMAKATAVNERQNQQKCRILAAWCFEICSSPRC